MADLKKSFDEVKDVATGMSPTNLMTSLQKDVSDSLQIGDIDKPVDSQVETSIAETAVTSEPVTPTTPAAPTPETFVEAEAHQAASEPLIITREAESREALAAVPQDITPPAQETLKNAKAS
jgi:sec-independent protein translocase protein TatB